MVLAMRFTQHWEMTNFHKSSDSEMDPWLLKVAPSNYYKYMTPTFKLFMWELKMSNIRS